jgi:flagellar protein FlbC
MQAVNIQQLLPQQTQKQTQTQTQPDAKPQKPEASSFEAALRSEKNNPDAANTQQPSPAVAAEKQVKPAVLQAEQNEQNEQAEKQRDSKKKSTGRSGSETRQDAAVLALLQNGRIVKPVAARKATDAGKETAVGQTAGQPAGKKTGDAEKLAWLFSSPETKQTDKTTAQEFEALIRGAGKKQAAEKPAGEKSAEPAEALAVAQQLSVDDPHAFLRTAAEKKSEGQDREIAGVEKKAAHAEARFTVYDQRTAPSSELPVQTVQEAPGKKGTDKELAAVRQQDQDTSARMTMDLVSHAEQNITASSGQTAAAAGSDFQSMLTSTVQQNAPEFVRAGTIVLKDNNQGTINLVLHPESLGNVKISLSLSDNVIAGQITVHSAEAYNAFRDSLDSIKQAFAQSGFDTAGFNLSFSGNGSGSFQDNGQNSGQRAEVPFLAERTYGDYIATTGTDSSQNKGRSGTYYNVDIVA